ncbi:MAG: low molecular weight protein arginine phosphatase [Bacillota bacterium]|nr:low molecular weight protein arginine phosphatase [Bacillota bacterium]
MTVIFVCTGNTCRSPMAAAVLRRRLEELGRTDVEVLSAGLAAFPGSPIHPFAKTALRSREIEAGGHVATLLDAELVEQADWILTMTTTQASEVKQRWPRARARVASLGAYAENRRDIRDPWGRNEAEYQRTLALIWDAISAWLAENTPESSC